MTLSDPHSLLTSPMQESEAVFRYLFINNPLPMWVYDLETLRFLEVNEAATTHYGYSREEFLQMRITDIRPAEDVPELLADIKKARPAFQRPYTWRHLLKDGQLIDVEISSHTLEFAGRQAVLVVSHDVTRRKQAEESALREAARAEALARETASLYAQERVHLRQVQALHTIDLAITSSVDVRIPLKVLLEQVVDQLDVDAAAVFLFNPHSLMLDYGAGKGFFNRHITQAAPRLGESSIGRAAFERQAISGDGGDPFLRSPLFAGEGFVAYYCVPLLAKGEVKGVLAVFQRTPLHPDSRWLDFLDAIAGQAAIAIDSADLFNGLQRSNAGLLQAYNTTIEGWSRALDLRDKETEGHTQRVTAITLTLAGKLGLSGEELEHMRRGALLHDIGKMGVPDHILLKPGPLTAEEWQIMRLHPVYAYQFLAPIDYLGQALDIPYCHHEKWDGTGYPRGLKANEIPLAARIFAIADVWDALTSDRPYRPAWPPDKARAYIRNQAGKHFDPRIVEAFLALEL